ncbi:hypothetical protein P152DRAFT_34829 [Eremomyces bilateralis CBS 781.70]|uniref:NPCC-domain-containing protein n=1 Tax=Eremomyces bilateralis CBS 781.70 TaxID=1392243 RepID=A0A6G1G316_9PEZI|nr:uncharacterized protein P152DRAFT_34829 [Eremomyces bilateralis CBS 781.70]KAF1812408.1 hypothetical protein P152DRAFT_34829 [Eremomyces bilateralis CBS 781.70]
MNSPGVRPSPRSGMASVISTKAMTPRPSPSSPAIPPTPTPSLPATPPMARWQHPRMNEINRRKSASTFGGRNIRTIVWSIALLVFSVYAAPAVYQTGEMLPVVFKACLQFLFDEPLETEDMLTIPTEPTLENPTTFPVSFLPWILLAFRVSLVGVIAHSMHPLFFTPDDFSDIPLTPTQRSLLNLPPLPASKTSTPASTPGSGIHTPPRLPHSPSTSARSRSPNPSFEPSTTRAVAGSSPVAFSIPPRFSPASGRRSASGSPMGMSIRDRSPLADSIGLGRSHSVGPSHSPSLSGSRKRWSMGGAGSPGVLGESSISNMSVGPGSPTPLPRGSAPNVGGVGLNNKWLYERFRSSGLGERRLYSNPSRQKPSGVSSNIR